MRGRNARTSYTKARRRCPAPIGDIRAGAMNRVASAVGEGSMAVRLVHEYLALT
jgi:hypothetical protein